jgi:hypothetical protein
LCPKSLSVPRRSQMSLLCLNLYPESHQDLLHTEQSICIIYDITFWFQSVENFINFFQSENSCMNEWIRIVKKNKSMFQPEEF